MLKGGCGSRRTEDGDSVVPRMLEAVLMVDETLVGVDTSIDSPSSSSSETVYDCLSFDGEVMGEPATRVVLGGVLVRLLVCVGEDAGEAGLRNGEDR